MISPSNVNLVPYEEVPEYSMITSSASNLPHNKRYVAVLDDNNMVVGFVYLEKKIGFYLADNRIRYSTANNMKGFILNGDSQNYYLFLD